MGRSQRVSQIQIQAFNLSVKSRGSQISPMHLIQLWPSGTGTPQEEQVQRVVQHPHTVLQESLLMAEPQLKGCRRRLHCGPQTQQLLSSHALRHRELLTIQSRCFPRVTRNCPFGLNTHIYKYIKCVIAAFKVLNLL